MVLDQIAANEALNTANQRNNKKLDKVAQIVHAHTIVQEQAVVVHSYAAALAHAAVVHSLSFDEVTLFAEHVNFDVFGFVVLVFLFQRSIARLELSESGSVLLSEVALLEVRVSILTPLFV